MFTYSVTRTTEQLDQTTVRSGVAVEDDLAEQIEDDTGFNANDARRIARLLRPVAGQAVQ